VTHSRTLPGFADRNPTAWALDCIAILRYRLSMPSTQVLFFQELDGTAPVLEWLRELKKKDRRGFAKCIALVDRLREAGHELRRPTADLLGDGIYELRGRVGNVNYRLLYFFHGRNLAVLAHSLTKEAAIPEADLDRALRRKAAFEEAPEAHTYKEK
jgi:phage-related protein